MEKSKRIERTTITEEDIYTMNKKKINYKKEKEIKEEDLCHCEEEELEEKKRIEEMIRKRREEEIRRAKLIEEQRLKKKSVKSLSIRHR